MRKLVVTENITLDGVIDASEGWFAPSREEDVDQSDLIEALRASDLVDEYRLFVYPVVMGRGARLFEDGTGVAKLRLVDCRPFRSGIVLTRYSSSES